MAHIDRIDEAAAEAPRTKMVMPVTYIDRSGNEPLQKQPYDPGNLSAQEKERLNKNLDKLNRSIEHTGKVIRLKYNEEIKQSYIEVVDIRTQEVVDSLPPEFLIDLQIKMKELVGLFIDKRL